MVKTKQILQILFLFIILIRIVKNYSTKYEYELKSLGELRKLDTDNSGSESSGSESSGSESSGSESSGSESSGSESSGSESSGSESSGSESSGSESSGSESSGSESSQESENIKLQKERCSETQPLKGIKEDCFQGNSILSGETCCYMTVKYKTNEHYECIAVNKDLKSIKNQIQEIKKNYEGSKSIDIDCNSSLIKISLIPFLLFIIFWTKIIKGIIL